MRDSQIFSGVLAAGIIGVVGGGAVVTAMLLSTRGWCVLVPYALVMVASFILFRRADIAGYGRRFALAFESYLVATLIAFAYVSTVNHRAMNAVSGQTTFSAASTRLVQRFPGCFGLRLSQAGISHTARQATRIARHFIGSYVTGRSLGRPLMWARLHFLKMFLTEHVESSAQTILLLPYGPSHFSSAVSP